MTDTIPPSITLISPSKDTAIGSDSCIVRVKCTDANGIASVVFSLGAANFPATKSLDSVWSATVSGLVSGSLNKITVTAVDASVNANTGTMIFSIKYDTTLSDLTGPVFFQKGSPANNAMVKDSIIAITDSIYDPSGVDSVYWTLNGKTAKAASLVSGSMNLYSIVDTLHQFHSNTFIIYAQDKSANKNKSNQTIVLNYNVPPVISDTAVSTNRNVAKTWLLSVLPVDGDTLAWSRITSPAAASGTVSGSLPTVIFTPATNWAGSDSFKIRVTDGHWSDTAKIKVTVVSIEVAPVIGTQPASATKNVGQAVTFSVTLNTDVNPAPTYQWKKNGVNISTASSYTISSIVAADSGSYTVSVTNNAGAANSQAAVLTVNYAPSITTQPLSQTLYLGLSASFTVVAIGKPTPTYVWKKNGVTISGQTGASLTIASPAIIDSGKYAVTVTNSVSSITSAVAEFYAVVKSVVAGNNHSFIIQTDGRLWGFGYNSDGQLGDGTIIDRSKPVQIASISNVQSVAAGNGYSLFLKTDGTLWACGRNDVGQLGDGTLIGRPTPVLITSINDVQSVVAGNDHTLFLKNDGTVWSCGNNEFGKLGDGTVISRSTPVQITSISNVQSIVAGGAHSLFLRTDGRIWGCGKNIAGQLGDTVTSTRSTPYPIANINNVQRIAAGWAHSLFQKGDGTLWASGWNYDGQLGDGTTDDRSAFAQIMSMSNVQAVAAGYGHSLVLKSDGTLWACGWNPVGQLGDNTTIDRPTLLQISTISNVKSISAGSMHNLVIKTDGTVWAFGDNSNGELGDGTLINRLTPVKIAF